MYELAGGVSFSFNLCGQKPVKIVRVASFPKLGAECDKAIYQHKQLHIATLVTQAIAYYIVIDNTELSMRSCSTAKAYHDILQSVQLKKAPSEPGHGIKRRWPSSCRIHDEGQY